MAGFGDGTYSLGGYGYGGYSDTVSDVVYTYLVTNGYGQGSYGVGDYGIGTSSEVAEAVTSMSSSVSESGVASDAIADLRLSEPYVDDIVTVNETYTASVAMVIAGSDTSTADDAEGCSQDFRFVIADSATASDAAAPLCGWTTIRG